MAAAAATTSSSRPALRVCVLELFPTSRGKADHPGAENMKEALSKPSFQVKLVQVKAMTEPGFLEANADVVVMPGGSSAQQAQQLGAAGRRVIREFVAGGGGYLGCCAGAFLALAGYHPQRSLQLLRASALPEWKVSWAFTPSRPHKNYIPTPQAPAFNPNPTHHLQRGHTRVPVTLSPGGSTLLFAKGGEKDDDGPGSGEDGDATVVIEGVRFNNGPCMVGMDDANGGEEGTKKGLSPPPGEPVFLARFEQGITAEDEASRNTAAVCAGVCGKGRVCLLSPHLESTPLRPMSLSKTAPKDPRLQACVRRAVEWAGGVRGGVT